MPRLTVQADDLAPTAEPAASPLTAAEAEELLDGLPLVPAMSGSIPEMKALRERCLAEGIPALIGCPPAAGKAKG
jgi:hypothetical protein